METEKVEELKKRLEPTHLKEAVKNIGELKKEVEESVSTEKEVKQDTPENDPKAQKEYTFNLNWTDGRGKTWKGEFTNKILNIGERSLVGNMRARLAGGLATNSLDVLVQEINYMLAHLAFSLVKRPDWAKELQELDDVRLLQEIYEKVASHEATFLGYGASSESS